MRGGTGDGLEWGGFGLLLFYRRTVITKLQAVNIILSGLGEPAIDTLDNPPEDVSQAAAMLDKVTEEIQLTGWHFNKDENRTLIPDGDGYINIPVDVHRVTFSDNSVPYIKKGGRLYDPVKGTYKIGRPVKADLTRVLPFDDMPLSFRHYAAVRAARKYQNNVLTSDGIRSFQEGDEMEAKLVCMKEEQAVRRPNIKGGYPGILNGWSVWKTLRR